MRTAPPLNTWCSTRSNLEWEKREKCSFVRLFTVKVVRGHDPWREFNWQVLLNEHRRKKIFIKITFCWDAKVTHPQRCSQVLDSEFLLHQLFGFHYNWSFICWFNTAVKGTDERPAGQGKSANNDKSMGAHTRGTKWPRCMCLMGCVLVLCQMEPCQHKGSSVNMYHQMPPIRSKCDWLDALKTPEGTIKHIKRTFQLFKH